MTGAPVLECQDLSAGYDQLAVVRGLDLAVRPGEVLALLGPNGAGKTTLLLTLAGFLPPLGGQVRLDGEAVRGGSARRMNRAGVVLVPDSRALFQGLTTLQNLELGARGTGISVDHVLDLFPVLRARTKLRAGMLSGGEQQMVALARALVQGPRVLLIDELSMGLAPIVCQSLLPLVRTVADETGTAVLLVEQHVHLALQAADAAIVLVHGEVSLRGTASELRADPKRLEEAYLGSTV